MTDRLEALVRDALDRDAEAIDPRERFARIQRSLGTRPARRRFAVPLVALAASLVGLVTLWHLQPPARASAEQLVRAARQAHHLPLDRCYLVELRKESELLEEGAPAVAPRVTRLWTRGDRFWIESVNSRLRWAWGRDDQGRVWMAFTPRRAVRMEPDETPRWLGLYCDLLTLQPEKLLSEVLQHFDLTREPGESPGTQVVRATRKMPLVQSTLRAAVLEIDSETKALRRLTVERQRLGQHVATVTYTLTETAVQEDGKYALEGHLVEPYTIFTREHQPERRLEVLKRWFGPQVGPWFLLDPKR